MVSYFQLLNLQWLTLVVKIVLGTDAVVAVVAAVAAVVVTNHELHFVMQLVGERRKRQQQQTGQVRQQKELGSCSSLRIFTDFRQKTYFGFGVHPFCVDLIFVPKKVSQ